MRRSLAAMRCLASCPTPRSVQAAANREDERRHRRTADRDWPTAETAAEENTAPEFPVTRHRISRRSSTAKPARTRKPEAAACDKHILRDGREPKAVQNRPRKPPASRNISTARENLKQRQQRQECEGRALKPIAILMSYSQEEAIQGCAADCENHPVWAGCGCAEFRVRLQVPPEIGVGDAVGAAEIAEPPTGKTMNQREQLRKVPHRGRLTIYFFFTGPARPSGARGVPSGLCATWWHMRTQVPVPRL